MERTQTRTSCARPTEYGGQEVASRTRYLLFTGRPRLYSEWYATRRACPLSGSDARGGGTWRACTDPPPDVVAPLRPDVVGRGLSVDDINVSPYETIVFVRSLSTVVFRYVTTNGVPTDDIRSRSVQIRARFTYPFHAPVNFRKFPPRFSPLLSVGFSSPHSFSALFTCRTVFSFN